MFITGFLQTFGLQIYFTYASNPILEVGSVQTIQSVFYSFTLFISIAIAIIMAVDIKNKAFTDWLLIVITFFNPTTGIVLFILRCFYLEWKSNQPTSINKPE